MSVPTEYDQLLAETQDFLERTTGPLRPAPLWTNNNHPHDDALGFLFDHLTEDGWRFTAAIDGDGSRTIWAWPPGSPVAPSDVERQLN